jgi:hypothetical protein
VLAWSIAIPIWLDVRLFVSSFWLARPDVVK